jgi:asparagine synthase (glutamine-hydrolysing)
MCGITAFLIHSKETEDITDSPDVDEKYYKEEILKSSKSIRHRGPDWSGNEICKSDVNINTVYMAHERLSIIGVLNGSQPIVHHFIKNGKQYKIVLCVNGEIYNYKEIKDECIDYKYKTESDCESIIALYLKYINDNSVLTQSALKVMISKLDGQFSFTLYDTYHDMFLVARDPIGITSLYYGFDTSNNLMICSEMKGLHLCDYVEPFPTGSALALSSGLNKEGCEFKSSLSLKSSRDIQTDFIHYYKESKVGSWMSASFETHIDETKILKLDYETKIYSDIRDVFTKAVKKRLMTDVPFGVLLSGGLDSSLIASIATKLVRDGEIDLKWGAKIHTFSIGLDKGDAPDSDKAIETSDYIGTIHHDFRFTIKDGIDAIRDVILHLETYDITTIRASTPMFLLSRKIKAMGVKMVLSGEGADELLGGYLYFLNAPSEESFFEETQRRVSELGYFDCLRANKSTLGWGVEGRFPFLDKEFVELCFKISPGLKCKNQIEKYVMRKAFDIVDKNGKQIYLPESILWRQKEQFSDGVGYGWIDSLKEYGEQSITDAQFETRETIYPVNTPKTKEAFLFRQIFEELFPNRENTVKKWIPRTDWEGVGEDPSGRAQQSHTQSY